MKVYLDVCCLNRLFDDESQPRVALEAEAVVNILQSIDSGDLTDYSSEMAVVEIERMPDPERRRKVSAMLPPAARIMSMSDSLLDAANALVKLGFELADAVHLAAARKQGVDAFVTVDDKLSKRAIKHRAKLGFRVLNPLRLAEELRDASDG